MPYRLPIAVAAGLVSAVVFASATTGPLLMRMVLFLLTPLALFLAGLGLGPVAAAVAALAGTFLVATVGGATVALYFAAGSALPAVILIYLAQLNRREVDGSVEWYPAGRLVIAAALLAGIFSMLMIFLLGGDVEVLRGNLRSALDQFINLRLEAVPDAPKLTAQEVDEIASVALAVFPGFIAGWAMFGLLLNFWLAGRITLASGRLQRPWPDLASIFYPPATPLLLAAATGASFLAGLPGLIATGFAGPLFLAYVLLGLAVVHYMSRGRPWGPFALWGLYASLFILNTIALPAIALLGLAEAIWPMRRISPPPKPPPPT